jgi:branched-chain amino acid transport system substrate-binding protein
MNDNRASIPFRRLPAALFLALGMGAADGADTPTKTIRIGALLSLTGNWSSLGEQSQIVLDMARKDINDYLASHGSNKRIKVLVKDTRLDPDQALEEFRRLIRQKAVAVVGPQSSSEVARLKDLADRKKVPLLSQGSTASSLSVANDQVYRLVPDDTHEAEAMAALLRQRGVTAVVPVWRGDAGNDGLQKSLKARFEAAGGTMLSGVRYGTDAVDFGAVAAEVGNQVTAALQGRDNASVAVYLAGFDEVVSLFQAAADIAPLKSVKWYGSDGVALSGALQADATAAAFAMAVDYPNPTLGLTQAAKPKWQALSDRVFAATGKRPDAFALAAYDALWVAALNASYQKKAQKKAERDILAETAGLYFGTTGWTMLNESGDRSQGSYDFWALRRGAGGTAEWVVVCRYDALAGSDGGLNCSE